MDEATATYLDFGFTFSNKSFPALELLRCNAKSLWPTPFHDENTLFDILHILPQTFDSVG